MTAHKGARQVNSNVINKMIKSIILICIIGTTSFIYTDLKNPNTFFSMFLPFIDFISLVALALWFVTLFHKKGITQSTGPHTGDTGSGFSGSDGSGGDC